MEKRKIKAWITRGGKHIPIFEGESKEDAIKRMSSKSGNLTKETLMKNKGAMKHNGYHIEIGKNDNGSFGKRVWVTDPNGNDHIYNSVDKAIEAVNSGKSLGKKTPKVAHEHIINENNKRAEEKESFVVGNNPPTEKEQAWMNAKAIRISKYMPKEKQAELRKQKREYQKQYKTWQDKDEETKKKQIAVSEKQKEERNSSEKSPYHSTRKSTDRLLNPINAHEYRVSNNEDVKSAIQDASKRIFDNEELIGHAMQMKYDNMEGFWYRGSAVVTRRKNGWNLSPDDTGGARKALMQAHYEVTGETKKPGNKFNYKDRETARKVFEKSSYIMSKLEEEENDKKSKK